MLSFIGTLKTQNMLSNLIIFLLTSEEAPIIIDIFHLICICFSGDHDMCVPYTGSLAWTTSLGSLIRGDRGLLMNKFLGM